MLSPNTVFLSSGASKKLAPARWSSRIYRRQRALNAAAKAPGQQKITEYFHEKIANIINENEKIREDINLLNGKDKFADVKPVLKKLFENAEKNSGKKCPRNYRHDETVKKFASSLFCLVGKGAYEMLQANLGCALPTVPTLHRKIASRSKIKEGEFRFKELSEHLDNWKAPKAVHIHLDDTRILNRVEYDPTTDRFVGFCLPIRDGVPCGEEFVLQKFEELENVFKSRKVASYAHCIIAQPVSPDAPSFVLCVLGTDSTYTHVEIEKRWQIIEDGLKKQNIAVLTNGADGAGPFLKAMVSRSKLFGVQEGSNVPCEWTFYLMPALSTTCLYAQDTIHLLAKLRTRLLMPSNILSIGAEVACRGHLVEILKEFPKEKHGLTQKSIDFKDKQNYSSIELLVSESVEECLRESGGTMRTQGTMIYLQLMRDIKNSMFDKSLKPIKRLYLVWKAIFFLRMWRTWLTERGLPEGDHFITNNAYTCIELNGHMLLNLVHNVAVGLFPKESLRVWMAGSQACEQLFRLLRSMTPVFSTIVNFTLKGILEKIHKIQYMRSTESDDEIVFPRLKRRLLQAKDETEDTFVAPCVEEITQEIVNAKEDAIDLSKKCGIELTTYDDVCLVKDIELVVDEAVRNDDESFEDLQPEPSPMTNETILSQAEAAAIREDLSQVKLRKATTLGLPAYEKFPDELNTPSKTYSLFRKERLPMSPKCPFLIYNGTYIRKSTALYLLQENFAVSNDRLLRVRAQQPSHIFSRSENGRNGLQNAVRSGDLCLFKRVDSPKCLIGRLIQFSYLEGNKRERQYSSMYVDMTKESHKGIGVFANWFEGTHKTSTDSAENAEIINFKPLDFVFAPGYVSMKHYVATIDDSALIESAEYSFSISVDVLIKVLPQWKSRLTFDLK